MQKSVVTKWLNNHLNCQYKETNVTNKPTTINDMENTITAQSKGVLIIL